MSKKYSLNKEDLISISKGAGIAVGGALLVYVSQTISDVDFGQYTEIIVAISAIIINMLRKWLQGK